MYASLVWHSRTTLINTRLSLLDGWTEDDERCEKAGILEEARVQKTSQQLAFDMLKADMANGVRFGWVGGDGLYGHGYELSYAIDDLGLTFLFDVHCDQPVYLDDPTIVVPEKKPGRGRTPIRLQTDIQSITDTAYHEGLKEEDQQEVTAVIPPRGLDTQHACETCLGVG